MAEKENIFTISPIKFTLCGKILIFVFVYLVWFVLLLLLFPSIPERIKCYDFYECQSVHVHTDQIHAHLLMQWHGWRNKHHCALISWRIRYVWTHTHARSIQNDLQLKGWRATIVFIFIQHTHRFHVDLRQKTRNQCYLIVIIYPPETKQKMHTRTKSKEQE